MPWSILWIGISLFLQCRFLGKMLGEKYRYTFLWYYLGNVFYSQVNMTFSLAMTTRVNMLYNIVCTFLLHLLLFHGSVRKKCFFTLWVYCFPIIIFGALYSPAHAIAIFQGLNGCPDLVISGIGIAAGLVQFAMMEVLQRRLHILKRDFTDQDALYLLYIIVFIFAAVDMLTEMFTGIQDLDVEAALWLAWPCSLIALAGVGLYVYCVIMLEKRLLQRSAKEQYQMMGRHLEALREQYQQLVRVQHDSRNHALCLTKLLEDEKPAEALCYLKQLDAREELGRCRVQTGSVYADALLTPKYAQAKRLGIDISVSVATPGEQEVAPVDLCCLLANALDNAIEACQRGDHPEDGWIRMKAYLHKKYWVFEISNSVFVPPVAYRGKLLSSKRRQAYGVGLQNIQTVVERYGGVMELENGEHFTLSVMLPRRAE